MNEVAARKRKIVIIGTGGKGRDVLGLLSAHNAAGRQPKYEVLGFLTSTWDEHGTELCGMPVLGPEDLIVDQDEADGVWAVCAIAESKARTNVTQNLMERGVSFATAVHPGAHVCEDAVIATGSIVGAGAVLGSQAQIGRHVMIDANATIGHDASVEDFVTVAAGARVSEYAAIGQGAELGPNCVIAPHAQVGRGAIIEAGVVVSGHVDGHGVVSGSFAEVIRKLAEDP